MKNINVNKVKNRRLVSGALYDFVAYLTSLKNPIMIGGSEDCVPAVDALVEWAQSRGLDIDDNPDIAGWQGKV
jgi:hypothetical protein